MKNPYESFYHGLVASKLWLCEVLEPIIYTKTPVVHILGGWHNLMSFIMVIRNPTGYKEFHSYDIDSDSVNVANRICDTWHYEEPKIYNHMQDVCQMQYPESNFPRVVINCSMDQMDNNTWFDNIPEGALVCIQTTDCHQKDVSWEIKQYTPNITEMIKKFPKLDVSFSGNKRIQYSNNGYTRLMLIGTKV